MMQRSLFYLVISITAFNIAQADVVHTGTGNIVYTQGHIAPSCRTVAFKDTLGVQKTFRIADVTGGHDDVSAVVLAALTSGRSVDIAYDPAVTSGCGTEPRITYITIQ